MSNLSSYLFFTKKIRNFFVKNSFQIGWLDFYNDFFKKFLAWRFLKCEKTDFECKFSKFFVFFRFQVKFWRCCVTQLFSKPIFSENLDIFTYEMAFLSSIRRLDHQKLIFLNFSFFEKRVMRESLGRVIREATNQIIPYSYPYS